MARVKVNDRRFKMKMARLKFMVNSNVSPAIAPFKRAFRRHIKAEYVRILKSEMGRTRELDILNRGFIVRRGNEVIGLPVGQVGLKVGTAEGGRFFTGQWTPIAQAVAEEEILTDLNAPQGVIRVGAVNARSVRDKTQFRWQQRDKRGRFKGTGVTEPFGGMWLQVLERGGQVTVPNFGRVLRNPRVLRGIQFVGDGEQTVRKTGNTWTWTVQPREQGRLLAPEPKVYVAKMRKTVAPISMFSRALFTGTRPLMRSFQPDFIRMVIRVGGFIKGTGQAGPVGSLPA